MKAIGGIIAWLGGMAILLGLLFILMSLKNLSDLNVWFLIGAASAAFGLLLVLIGWVIYQSAKSQDQSHPSN